MRHRPQPHLQRRDQLHLLGQRQLVQQLWMQPLEHAGHAVKRNAWLRSAQTAPARRVRLDVESGWLFLVASLDRKSSTMEMVDTLSDLNVAVPLLRRWVVCRAGNART